MTTEETMERRADEMTADSRVEAVFNRETEWDDYVKDCWRGDDDYDRLFKEGHDYFAVRRKDLAEGRCRPGSPTMTKVLAKVLAFDFYASYDVYAWTGKGDDPNDGDLFEVVDSTIERLDSSWDKDRIVRSLGEYLKEGAVSAKKRGSIAYPMWCRALADFEFRFDRFQDCQDEKPVVEFLESVDVAAQMLWVDCRVCEAAAEKPKNAKKPRPQKRRARQTDRV